MNTEGQGEEMERVSHFRHMQDEVLGDYVLKVSEIIFKRMS